MAQHGASAAVTAGPWRVIPIDGFGAPFYVIPFDKHGRCTAPATRAHLRAGEGPFTDVFLFSHGWNNDHESAIASYSHFIGGYCAARARHKWRIDRLFRPLLVGVLWPSAILVMPGERGPALAAGGAGGEEATIAVIANELGEGESTRLRELATRPGLDEHEWAELANLLAPLYVIDAEDGVHRAPDAAGLLRQWASTGGQFDVNPDPIVGRYAEVADGPAAAGIGGGVRDLIRQTTVWLMKDRAGRVGAGGVGPMLAELLAQHPEARFHLAGHSYGCKVLLSALCHDAVPRPVNSMLLLQAAINAECFSVDRGDGRPGGYRDALARTEHAIVATYSKDDVSLRRMFHRFLRRPDDEGEEAFAAETGPPPFAALGGWGPVGIDAETAWIRLPEPGRGFPAPPPDARVVAADATGAVRAHGDISNESTWWSLHEGVVAS